MYTRYFGLAETPFAISPNPRYLYMSELHREALAHLLYGISSDGCMILLTGDIGTGKTTLCRCLLEKLPENTDLAVILNPRLTARDLLKTICEEFGILPPERIASIKTYVDLINRYLLQSHADDRTAAIIIDEAQNLDIHVLEQLRMLTNLETDTKKLLRIILIGQPELRDLLEKPELIQVNQRITSRYHLGPLQPDDVRKYILHRLHVAGDDTATLFTEKAIQHAIKLTGGIPRLINVLCDRALLGAYAVNSDHVDLAIMKRAGKEIFPKKPFFLSRSTKALLIGGTLLITIAAPALIFLPGQDEQTDITEPVDTIRADNTTTENATEKEEDKPVQETAVEETEKIVDNTVIEETPPVLLENGVIEEIHTQIPSGNTEEMPNPSAEPLAEEPADEGIEEQMNPIEEPEQTTPPGKEEILPVSVEDPEPSISMDKSSNDTAPIEKPVNTITVSAPLLVLDKAGPEPLKEVEKLISR